MIVTVKKSPNKPGWLPDTWYIVRESDGRIEASGFHRKNEALAYVAEQGHELAMPE